jgi:hypothetical protein
MPTVRHPRDRDDVTGHLPARVTVNGESYAVEDGRVDLPTDADVRALAAAYGLTPTDLSDTKTCEVVKSDGDVCGRERPCAYHD